jgi:N-acyl-L-homoserine lactone synthetase
MSPAASTSHTDGAAALDRLSERLLAAAPWRVAVAQTDAERRAILRLRHRQVVEGGWTDAPSLPGGLERDAHDADALHVGAWDGAALTGAMRLVLPVAGRRLPVEEAFGIEVEPRGAVAEAGRLVIAPERRGDPAHRIWGSLFARAWIELRARGLSVLAGAASPRMVERLTALGLPFEVLGPAREHWGEPRHPVRLDPARAEPRWFD